MALTNASRLADFGTGIGTQGAILQVDNADQMVGIGTTDPTSKLEVKGDFKVSAASTLSGAVKISDSTNSTSTTTGALIVTGGVGIGASLHVDGDVSIGGTLTYEDVTNIDSVGLVTARSGLRVTAGGVVVTAGVSTFADLKVGTGITLNSGVTGIVTAAEFNTGPVSVLNSDTGGRLKTTEGWLTLQGTLGTVIEHTDGTNHIKATNGGAAELYYNGSVKLATSNTGTTITGAVVASDGFASNTDLILNSDNNANNSTNDSIIFKNSGTELARIKGTGSVGLGTAAPVARVFEAFTASTSTPSLTWQGGNPGQRFVNEGSELKFGLTSYSPYAYFIQANTSGSGQRQITLNPMGGSVAIGVTDPPTASGLVAKYDSTFAPTLTWNAAGGHIIRDEGSELNFGLSSITPHPFFIQGRTSGSAVRQIAINPLGGNVAINTSIASNTLNLGGNAGVGMRFHNYTSNYDYYHTVESGDKVQSNVGGTGYFTWTTGGTEKVRFANNGRIGVGTASPQALVDISGNQEATNLNLDGTFEQFATMNWNYAQQRWTRSISNTTTTKILSILCGGDSLSDTNVYNNINFVMRTSSNPATASTSRGIGAALDILAPESVRLSVNDGEKFRATNDGTVTTGICTATDFFVNTAASKGLKNTSTGQRLIQQASNETRIYHASNAQVKLTFRGSGDTYRGAVNADAQGIALLTGAASEEYGILCVADADTKLYYNAGFAAKTIETNSLRGFLVGSDTYVNTSVTHGELIVRKDLASPNNAAITQCARQTIITNEQTAGGNGYGGALFFGTQDVNTSDQYTTDMCAIGGSADGSDTANDEKSGSFYIWCRDGGTFAAHFKVRYDGNLYGTDTSISSLSDERLKENIEDFSFDLNKFKQLKPKRFNWKHPEYHNTTPSSGKHRGFIAQDLEKIDDEFVDTLNIQDKESPEFSLVDEGGLGKTTHLGKSDAMYVSVINQLIAKIETLEAKVAALESA